MTTIECETCGRYQMTWIDADPANGRGSALVHTNDYKRKNGQPGLIHCVNQSCSDCVEAMPPYRRGEIVGCRAWWSNGRILACEVKRIDGDLLLVEPVTGNRHQRYVSLRDIATEAVQ